MVNKNIEFSFGILCFFCFKGRSRDLVNKICASILRVFFDFPSLSSQLKAFIQIRDMRLTIQCAV